MTKLPPNAYRTTINRNPYIVHEDGKGNIIRLEDDYATAQAKKPPNARFADMNKQRFVPRGKALSNAQ